MTPEARHAWRAGIAPELSLDGLEALRCALIEDDPNLLQKSTVEIDWAQAIKGSQSVAEARPTGCCPMVLPGWLTGDFAHRAGALEEFRRISFAANKRAGDALAAVHFTGWWDDEPRQTARVELLAEVEWALEQPREDAA
jgi:hypothetical protein